MTRDRPLRPIPAVSGVLFRGNEALLVRREASSYVGTRFEIALEEWVRQSAVISFALRQRRLTDYPGWAG